MNYVCFFQDLLEKDSVKQVDLTMPLSNKKKEDEDAPCERKSEAVKQVDLAMPWSNKQKEDEDAPRGRKSEATPAGRK